MRFVKTGLLLTACMMVGPLAAQSINLDKSFEAQSLAAADSALAKDTSEPDQELPAMSFGETLKKDLRDLPRSLWTDTKAVYTSPKNLGILLIGGGATLAVRNTDVDDKWEHHFDKHRSFRACWGDTGGVIGNPGLHFGVAAAMYAYGATLNDGKTYGVGKALFNALVITDLSTILMKTAACTEAPNGEDWAWPSGHTSSSFAMAAVLDKYYGHWVGFPAYGLAGFVGFERMDDREHFFSDVLFGAVLGYVVGSTVADGHAPQVLGGDILPYIDPIDGKSGIAWVKDF